MIELRTPAPNWTFEDLDGKSYSLWDFRQKSHVVIVYDPNLSRKDRERWQTEITAHAEKWEWLRVKFIFAAKGPADVPPNVLFVDRWGTLYQRFALDAWSFAQLENEVVYYEARHC